MSSGDVPSVPRASTQKLEPLGRKAYAVLRRAIREGVIQADRHYSETELGQLLGVSRTPVREALKALERDGVLDSASPRGYRLRSFSEEEIGELVELRKLLERFAVERLTKRATEQDIARLTEVVARQRTGDVAGEIFALDEEFHLLIAELAGLPRTRDMQAALRSAMAITNAGASVSDEETRVIIRQHEELVAAIAGGDRDRAVEAMTRHVDDATRMLLESARRRASGRALLRLSPG